MFVQMLFIFDPFVTFGSNLTFRAFPRFFLLKYRFVKLWQQKSNEQTCETEINFPSPRKGKLNLARNSFTSIILIKPNSSTCVILFGSRFIPSLTSAYTQSREEEEGINWVLREVNWGDGYNWRLFLAVNVLREIESGGAPVKRRG